MHPLGKTGCYHFGYIFVLEFSILLIYIHTSLKPFNRNAFNKEKILIESAVELMYLSMVACSVTAITIILAWKTNGNNKFQVIWRSQLLATAFGIGLSTSLFSTKQYSILGWYICIMSFFHFSEFAVTSIIRPQNLTIDSFLLNHSKAYAIAAFISWAEYLVELWLLPGMKTLQWISILGLTLCCGGEALRKTAMLTAFHNFDHLIRIRREEHHELVTSGVYGLCRHPSYVGWFYWSIGTQMILCNPFCTVAYAIISWRFFYERIFEEEVTLLHFFGSSYVNYQKKVPTGLPFINGYI
nr:EOG090X0CFU [Macrothrix elegans]